MRQTNLFNYEEIFINRSDVDLMILYRDNLVKFLLDYHELRWSRRQELITELFEIQSWITINNF